MAYMNVKRLGVISKTMASREQPIMYPIFDVGAFRKGSNISSHSTEKLQNWISMI